ncbi:MAG: glycosyltransferase family 4 protein [Fusobacteriaceae bacterium]|nr:glycosyltransferase family 4 protein [Fusobacteriaceae bacterium]
MKKIILNAHISFALYNSRYGLMKELSEKGYEVVCVSGRDSTSDEIEKNGWKCLNVEIDRRGKNLLHDFKLFWNYLKIYKKERPLCILHYTIKPNIYGTIAAKILNIPVINNITGLGDTFGTSKLAMIVKILYKISFKFPKKVFFQNDDDMQIFIKNKLISKNICSRIPGSGVDIKKFDIIEIAKKDGKIIFLFLGRISNSKGVRIVNTISKEINKKYPNVEFWLLGAIYKEDKNHISKDELLKWEKESNIKYLGTSNDVREQIKEADCIIFPSYYREGVPRSLIESAAMGKPILTTDNVGCRDIVKDGYNGFLAIPRDAKSMLAVVEKFLSLSLEERKKMGINGRKKVEEEFDEKIVIKKYLDTIEEISRGY